MAEGSSEEKILPASQRKLRRLREEGQIPLSKDFVSFCALCGALVYLIVMYQSIIGQVMALITQAFAVDGHYSDNLAGAFLLSETLTLRVIFPVMISAALAAFVGYFYCAGGLVLNFKALAPKFDKLNPATNLKNIFGTEKLVETGKGLAKTLVLCVIFFIILKANVNAFFWSSLCGETCTLASLTALVRTSMIYGVAVLALFSFLDIFITKFMFLNKNKMSHSERKQEMKEDYGAPEVRRARRDLRAMIANSPNIRGMAKASFAITSGDKIIGICFVQGRTPAPVIVAKGDGARFAGLVNEAKAHNIKIFIENSLTPRLYGPAAIGQYVPQNYFNDIAAILVRERMVR